MNMNSKRRKTAIKQIDEKLSNHVANVQIEGTQQSRLTVSELKHHFQSFLSTSGYSELVKQDFNREFFALEKMMENRGIQYYSTIVGEQFLSMRFKTINTDCGKNRIISFIHKLDFIYEGRDISKHYCSPKTVPATYQHAFDEYINDCRARGNAKGTIYRKQHSLAEFFSTLIDVGCTCLGDLSPETVLKACASLTSTNIRSTIKLFLHFAFESNFIKVDLSPIVPSKIRRKPLPTTYTLEELNKIEYYARHRDHTCAKRDLVIILISIKYGFRVGDICALTMSNFDLTSNRIAFVQQKNSMPIDVPLYPDVKIALLDYYNGTRPNCDIDEIFLSTTTPIKALSRTGIYHIINHAFKAAGIDTKGKHHGTHALRSSNVSLKINSGMTYDQTKESIGWANPNTIKNYARIDVENLRICALDPVQVTKGSFFEKFLQGKERIN